MPKKCDAPKLYVTLKSQIAKYAVGKSEANGDEPYEIIENETVLVGQDARDFLLAQKKQKEYAAKQAAEIAAMQAEQKGD